MPLGLSDAGEQSSAETGERVGHLASFAAAGSAFAAAALGTVLVPAGAASATEGFTCPAGTGNNARTEVRFTQPSTGDRVELRYEPGLTRIK